MFDKLLENALAQYLPRLEKMTDVRKSELAGLRAKVRTCPEEVESWFDKEIEKLSDNKVKDLISNLKENGTPDTTFGTESLR